MDDKPRQKKFPEGFLWGASTSSHQVEGNNWNDWAKWELEHASENAKLAPKHLGWVPTWNEIKEQAQDPGNYVSGTGVEHYTRYKEDFDLVQKLNLNAFRFSIEWSRIEPEEGQWKQEAVEHYRQYVKELKARGIEPMMNIWHWTSPVWFMEKGGFVKRENLKYFDRFVAKVAAELCKDVTYIITLNEPNIYVWFSYIDGSWPPQGKSFIKGYRVLINLISAHKRAYKILKRLNPELLISSAPQMVSNVPLNKKNIWHVLCAWSADYINNWFWLRRCRKHQDFIGFNNYFKNYMTGLSIEGIHNTKTPLNDLGWYMEPKAVAEIAVKISKLFPGMPIMVTENGVADMHDQYRQWWIEETLKALGEAISQGVDIRGYFHWSLLDNFEWAYGWWPKFGLVEVDREKDMKRTVRPSAKWYAEKVKDLRK